MTRMFATLLLLTASTAQAGPASDWMPAAPDCTVAAAELDASIVEAKKACSSCSARKDQASCMADAGWVPAADGERDRYDRFCALTARLLDRSEDDPAVVATPMPTTRTAMSNPK